MKTSEAPSISRVEELLAEEGYQVEEQESGLLKAVDVETGVSFQVALEGNVLYMSVVLTSVPRAQVTAEVMRKMLLADNGVSTSAFKIIEADDRAVITLNTFCTLQNMGEEDQDDIMSMAGYLMADLLEARELIESCFTAAPAKS